MLKVTCAIILRQNKILVAQRSANTDHPLKWEYPGGKINKDETAEECIIREIREEIEVEIEIQEKMAEVFQDYGFKQIELIPFLCTIKSGKITLNEHNDFNWFKLSHLKNIDLAEADRKILINPKNKMTLEKYLGENMNDTR